jgi:hypothetical protein
MEDESTDKELAVTWRYFASWREKLFGGFLAVLAGLGISFFRTPLPVWRLVVCLAAIVVSVAFWLIDLRTGQLLNASQAAGAKRGLEVFAALEVERFEQSKRWITYGFAIDLLVGIVVAGSVAGAIVYWNRLPEGKIGFAVPSAVVVVFLVFVLMSQRIRTERFQAAKKNR